MTRIGQFSQGVTVTPAPNIMCIYFPQKQLPRKMKSRLVIIECAGCILWQFFVATIVESRTQSSLQNLYKSVVCIASCK